MAVREEVADHHHGAREVDIDSDARRAETAIETYRQATAKFGAGRRKKGYEFESAVNSQADFERGARATWQALGDLIARRRKIKTAVVVANAVPKVEVAGENMAIAEATEKKNMSDVERKVTKQMRAKLIAARQKVDGRNRDVERKLMKLLEATYAKQEAQLSKEDYDRIARPFNKSNEAKLVDSLNCERDMQGTEERIANFFHKLMFV